MNQRQFNDHGQPFSKKQKKASRTMMSLRNGFKPRAAGTIPPNIESKGFMAALAAMMFGFKVRRKAA